VTPSGAAPGAPGAADERPRFPQRAVVTAGMPYGNKGLHFGHIGGVFIPADVFARFLRDRIGEQNVLFVSGTDCFGSPIDEGYRKLCEDEPDAVGKGIEAYVELNHQAQLASLRAYDISLDVFEGSGLGASRAVHAALSSSVLGRLYANGYLKRLDTEQFYDEQAQSFLNGRQVTGRCPVAGCKSERGYADECDLGHQYFPADLIAPVSSLSGQAPVLRKVENWYFDLPAFRGLLGEAAELMRHDGQTRKVVYETVQEFLADPLIYIKEELLEPYQAIATELPAHRLALPEAGKKSFELGFDSYQERDRARQALGRAGIQSRTGKALVPFRITGNISWGVPAPVFAGLAGLTIWCWPESLWAPVSFTQRRLMADHGADTPPLETLNPGRLPDPAATWQDYWCDPQSRVYQFIGQDNIYFYGVAQTALFAALPARRASSTPADPADPADRDDSTAPAPALTPPPGELQQTQLVANYHLQFLNRKASSSGAVKPPMADDLLDFYTAEQLRAHFIALGLGLKPVSFQPKALNPNAAPKDADPVLKEGQLLTNVLNRLARSCFYEAQANNNGCLPLAGALAAAGADPARIQTALQAEAARALVAYEHAMSTQELHQAMSIASDYVRAANKAWSADIKTATEDPAARLIVLYESFYRLRACLLMMHPIAPQGTSKAFSYLGLTVAERDFFSWQHVAEDGCLAGFEAFASESEQAQGAHQLCELPPRSDFFERHASQFD